MSPRRPWSLVIGGLALLIAIAVLLTRTDASDPPPAEPPAPQPAPRADRRELRAVPQIQAEVVERGDGSDGVRDVLAAAPVIAEDSPVLEPREDMLDASPPSSM